jgi:gluconolactonase
MKVEVLATGLEFPEGPFLDANGDLVVTEINAGKLTKIAADGTKSLFAETGGGPNGAALAPDGSVYVCNNGGQVATDGTRKAEPGRIQRVTADGKVEDFITEVEGVALDAPNDCVFDKDGGFWFTNPNGFGKLGSVCYRSPDGATNRVTDGIQFPNGIGITPDGRFLVICESMTGSLLSHEIEGPGKVGDRKINGNIGRRSIPDGYCVDSEGRMIVAGFRTNNLFVLDMTDGRPLEFVELPGTGPTNSCFGGPDFRTLFITSSTAGEVLKCEWPVPGMRLH